MVIEVSAMLVVRTIFLWPTRERWNTACWSATDKLECTERERKETINAFHLWRAFPSSKAVYVNLFALSYMVRSSVSLRKNGASPPVFLEQPWCPAIQGGNTALHLKHEGNEWKKKSHHLKALFKKAKGERLSARYLALHVYQCAQLHQPLNLDLVQPCVFLP